MLNTIYTCPRALARGDAAAIAALAAANGEGQVLLPADAGKDLVAALRAAGLRTFRSRRQPPAAAKRRKPQPFNGAAARRRAEKICAGARGVQRKGRS
jgi:hypothetical protein